jgi:hypothetical protein
MLFVLFVVNRFLVAAESCVAFSARSAVNHYEQVLVV